MRIAIGEFNHEANTFIRDEVQLDYMKQLGWHHGQELIAENAGYRSYIGGMLDAASSHDIEILPTFSAHAGASGTLARSAYELARTELLTALEAVLPVDAVCLALHGAAIANGYDDPEGDILVRVRELVGPNVPIVATLDLHGNITQEMVANSDLLLGVNFYPHIDMYDRGVEAIIRTVQIVRGEIRPTSFLALPPMIIPSTTSEDPSIHTINEACWAWEAKPGVLDCTFFHGFGWTDLPRSGVSVYAATNNDPKLAKEAAEDVAAFIWSRRDTFLVDPVSPAEAIQKALAVEGQPVVINDGSDDPGGGAPGDGTYLLQAMLDAKLTNACFGFIVDPEVAEQAHAAGAGATIDIRIGGKVDDWHGETIATTAYVKSITDGRFIHSTPMVAGSPADYGKCARLQIEGIDVIVTTFRTQTIDKEIFVLHGIDIMNYKIVALKSSDHFRAGFRPFAAEIIGCHTRGLVSADFTTFPYKRLQRPIWPLDRTMGWQMADDRRQ